MVLMITFWGIIYGRSLIDGEWGRLYSNAIRSWQALECEKQIVILGGPEHRGECQTLGVEWYPAPCDEQGRPLVNESLMLADKVARHPLQCYLCLDLILGNDFVSGAKYLSWFLEHYLAVGRRFDVAVPETMDYGDLTADGDLATVRQRATRDGKLEHGTVVSYLLYTDNIWHNMPPFRCNHSCYDNFMVWEAINQGMPVIDMTGLAVVVHQQHDHHYNHATGDRLNYDMCPPGFWFAGVQAASFVTHYRMTNPLMTLNTEWGFQGMFDPLMHVQDDNGDPGYAQVVLMR